MNDTKIGGMPSGMPDDILRDLDYRAAIKFVADDIASNCQNVYIRCELAERLLATNSPISFDEIDEHIPETAEYTSEEIVRLYCSVAAFKEAAKNNNGGEIEAASRKVDEAISLEEFNEAMDTFRSVYNEVGERSQNSYDKWMESCYA